MKNIIELDYAKIEEIEYDAKKYFGDIQIFDLVNSYAYLMDYKNEIFKGDIFIKGNYYVIEVDKKVNKCFLNRTLIEPYRFMLIFEKEEKIFDRINEITGICMDNYISRVIYKDGSETKFEV